MNSTSRVGSTLSRCLLLVLGILDSNAYSQACTGLDIELASGAVIRWGTYQTTTKNTK